MRVLMCPWQSYHLNLFFFSLFSLQAPYPKLALSKNLIVETIAHMHMAILFFTYLHRIFFPQILVVKLEFSNFNELQIILPITIRSL